MKPFYRFARTVIYPFFLIFQPVKVIGKENIPNQDAFILCSNHTSMTDPFFTIAIFARQIYFMAKAELFKIGIFRAVLNAVGTFAVDRGKGDMSAINQAQNLIKEGKILGIYPEGTRHVEGPPHKAKSGIAYIAMDTKADILPMSIYREGKYNLFKKTTIRIGKLIKYDDLVSEDASVRANMKNIVDTVTKEITNLWEMKH
ncbi:MAG: 1-acyl-sn-glycerol-3-phosphate acyltransferase [Clostridia bacterium]|nr:1-acyl-sn-glycerol-3-phosphate acyltransferase [Clostridia bacterium]